MVKKKPILRRYTDLPALISILRRREITLLSPSSWDDRNDRHLMDAYKRARKLNTLLAVCFSEVTETYHHWRVFTPGNSGVCIEFDREALLKELPKSGITHSSVDYMTIARRENSTIEVDDLPFTKRAAFSDEKEFRIVFSSRREKLATKNLPITLSTIDRIAINPWLSPALFESIQDTILSIDGCEEFDVYQSTLIESPSWKSFAGNYV